MENQTLEVIRLQSEVEEYEYQVMCEGYSNGVTTHTKTTSLDSGHKASDNDDDDDEEYEEAEDLGGENHW